MASFAYSAINAQGAELSGEISAADLSSAREQLRVKGLLAQYLKEISEGSGIGQTSIGGLDSFLYLAPVGGDEGLRVQGERPRGLLSGAKGNVRSVRGVLLRCL